MNAVLRNAATAIADHVIPARRAAIAAKAEERRRLQAARALKPKHIARIKELAGEEAAIMVRIRSGELTTLALTAINLERANLNVKVAAIQGNDCSLLDGAPEEMRYAYRKLREDRTALLRRIEAINQRLPETQYRLTRMETASKNFLDAWASNKHAADTFSTAEAEKRIEHDARDLSYARRELAETEAELATMVAQREAFSSRIDVQREKLIIS